MGGSFASGLYGEPRSTNDVDMIACLCLGDVRRFVAALGEDVYVDVDVIREAIVGCRSFDVLDERTFVKIDVFVTPLGPLGEGQLLRRRQLELSDGASTWVLGPGTCCCRSSPGTASAAINRIGSGAIFCAILSVSKVEDRLDFDYLEVAATGAGLSSLLERAKHDVTG